MKNIVDLLQLINKKIKKALLLKKYNSFNKAEYLRTLGTQIGLNCSIIPNNLGTEPYLIKIGNHVTIAQGVKFMTHDGGAWVARIDVPDVQVFGPIVIEDNCVIGENAILFGPLKIGTNSIVGAGSVVIKDVPPDCIVMGNPARPFGSTERYKAKCIEKWKSQKPADVVLDDNESWWNSKHFSENREKLKKHLLEYFKNDLK